MSNTTDMNTETETDTENITTIIKEETGLTIAPPRRKRQLKKAAEPSMKEATELAEGKTLVIKEEKEEEKPNCGAGQPAEPEPNWKQLYLELKEKTDPLLVKLEQQRQKRNEASKKSKKACREKNKAVKTDLEERVKKLEEKVAEKDFKEVLDEDGDCENCSKTFGEDDNCGKGYTNEVAGSRVCEECWLVNKCGDCDNHEDDIGDDEPRCSECRKKYEDEEQSDAE
jgi:hypothetical protein